MTGTIRGTISIWENGKVSNSINCEGTNPLIKVFGQNIIVASKGGKLLVLDTSLKITKEYETIYYQPYSVSVTRKYIAIGTFWDVIFYQRSGSTVRIKLKYRF